MKVFIVMWQGESGVEKCFDRKAKARAFITSKGYRKDRNSPFYYLKGARDHSFHENDLYVIEEVEVE